MAKYPISFSQGVTVVPNSLLLQVTQGNDEIKRQERREMIKLLKHVLSMEANRTYKDRTYADGLRDAISLVEGENK